MPSAAEEDAGFMQGVESILKGTFAKGRSTSSKKSSKQEKPHERTLHEDSDCLDQFLGSPAGMIEMKTNSVSRSKDSIRSVSG
jgi:hypothetical protein